MLNRIVGVLRRKEVLSLCLMIFTADVVSGTLGPGFSLYATSLGASLTLIGALGGIEGLTRIVASVPLGILSDVRGRKSVLLAGMLLFVISCCLFAMVQAPLLFLPIRIMTGLAMVCTYFVGVAYIGDLIALEERGLVIGVYTTSMGLGFATGSALGGQVTALAGYPASCLVAAGVALAGFSIGLWGLTGNSRPMPAHAGGALPLRAQLALLRDPHLLAASIANLANNAWYSTVISFFPIYAASLAVGEGTLGSMFAIRSLMSAAARLPTGLLTMRMPSRHLVMAALGAALLVFGAVAGVSAHWLLGALLAVEGVAYGVFLTSGQAYVAEQSDEASRGSAIGVYSTAGGIGSTGGPLLLGLLADLWGVRVVFWATGLLVLASMALVWAIGLRRPAPAKGAHGTL